MAFFSTPQFSDDDDDGDARPPVYYEEDPNEHLQDEEPDYGASQGDDPWRASVPIWWTVNIMWCDVLWSVNRCYWCSSSPLVSHHRGRHQRKQSIGEIQQSLPEERLHCRPHLRLPGADGRGHLPGLPDHLRVHGEAQQPRDVRHLQRGQQVLPPRFVWLKHRAR